jgi:hypothetical protein
MCDLHVVNKPMRRSADECVPIPRYGILSSLQDWLAGGHDGMQSAERCC